MNSYFSNIRLNKIVNKQPAWTKTIPLLRASSRQFKEANLRTQFPDEVTLDLEDPKNLWPLMEKVFSKQWTFSIWSTGSRGYHLQLYFPQMMYYKQEERNDIRKNIIAWAGTDPALASEKHFLAFERSPHYKTGRMKRLVCFYRFGDGINVIPPEFEPTNKKKRDYCSPPMPKGDWLALDPVYNYLLGHNIPIGGINDKLLKNIAVGMVLCGYDDERVRKEWERFKDNLPPNSFGSLNGWVQHWRRERTAGRRVEYNKREILGWLRKNMEVLS